MVGWLCGTEVDLLIANVNIYYVHGIKICLDITIGYKHFKYYFYIKQQ